MIRLTARPAGKCRRRRRRSAPRLLAQELVERGDVAAAPGRPARLRLGGSGPTGRLAPSVAAGPSPARRRPCGPHGPLMSLNRAAPRAPQPRKHGHGRHYRERAARKTVASRRTASYVRAAMTDPDDPLAALDGIRTPRASARASSAGGVATLIVDATGLERRGAHALEERAARRGARRCPGVDEARIAMTARSRSARSSRSAAARAGSASRPSPPISRSRWPGSARRSGWSTPTSTARRSRPCSARTTSPTAEDDQLIPVEAHGVRLLSLGQLVSPGHALAWRGPMATGALAQLIDADWGDTELLVVDLPPGTGDVQMSLIQKSRPDGRGDRLDPAGPVADRRHPRDRPVPQDGRAGARPHREHGGLRLPALRRGLAIRSGAAAPRRRRASWACRSSAGCRSSSRSATASDAGTPPAAGDGAEARPSPSSQANCSASAGDGRR